MVFGVRRTAWTQKTKATPPKAGSPTMTNIHDEAMIAEESDQPATHPATVFPPEPSSIQETGLSGALLTRLVVKALYVMGELTEASIGQQIKVPYSIVKGILTDLRKEKYCEVKGPC